MTLSSSCTARCRSEACLARARNSPLSCRWKSCSTLPDAALAATPHDAAPAMGRALRVLVAEDNLTNQLVLRALLEPLDLDLDLVTNGAEAVAAFQEGAFDLVLMDIQMPVMSGVEAALAIRRIEAAGDRGHIPIIALSANVMTHHLAEYRAAGMDAHVAKPIEIEKLYALLQQVAAGAPLEFQLAG